MIQIWLDVSVPYPKVDQQSGVFERVVGSKIEPKMRKTYAELLIHKHMQEWDQQYPLLRHELIVRSLCGFVVSTIVTTCTKKFIRSYNRYITRR
jgi:hypothetical protein